MRDTRIVALPAVLVVGFLALVLLRHVAMRRLGTHQARYAWLSFAPSFLFPAAILWVAITQAWRQPIMGLVLGLIGVGYGFLLVRMVRGVARATASAGTRDELMGRMEEPTTDFLLITTIFGVVGLIVLGVALIVAAVVGGRP
jgi:beta-lactamase regulating signal transducer with metallopeptidase domain